MIEDELDVGGGASSAVQKSLKTMQAARSRLHVLSSEPSTPAVLISQIELCDLLLDELRSISCSVEKRAEPPSTPSRRAVANRYRRGTAHLVAPQRTVPGRTKQRK
ncbi:hypothetical protein [Bradyrhizobium aeschynomenes]|uniref:hypothetical protein n=1 Tax=Bradyrhizobium aeschynomenes TaxID=2734909 RepID=UPI001FEDA63C|nr:hypothetical protein [Bradyrhizobium aeschynomenes]